MDNFWSDADVISRYTRAQALEDGDLVDAGAMASEAGFTWPVALTRAAWADCVAWKDDARGQSEAGRLWDVLSMGRLAIRMAREGGSELRYRLHRVRWGEVRALETTLKLVVGPGDDGEPVVTLMLPDED